MEIVDALRHWRSRAVWRDPARTLLTLESFARTEDDGGRDIATAARRVRDEELRGHLLRHAADEARHAELFRRRAQELREAGGAAIAAASRASADVSGDAAYDLSRGRPGAEVDAHGFFTVGRLDELGEVPYVAMLHVAERRAARLFAVHAALTRHDPATHAIFGSILRDEHYHVAWTGAVLEAWRREGRDAEVRSALELARGDRLLGAWKRLGVRAGANFSRLLLLVLYATVLAPFGLYANRRREAPGWRVPREGAAAPTDPLAAVRSQA